MITLKKVAIKVLEVLFPVRKPKIDSPEEMKEWTRYAVSNYTHLDPFRPIGYRDSSARIKSNGPTIGARREASKGDTNGASPTRLSSRKELERNPNRIASHR